MTPRWLHIAPNHAVIVVTLALLAAFALVFLWPTPVLPDAVPTMRREMPPVGTYQYLHIEGPLMLAWDTRTGAYKFCLIRPGEQGMALDCGAP